VFGARDVKGKRQILSVQPHDILPAHFLHGPRRRILVRRGILLSKRPPEHCVPGIVLAFVSLNVMPLLSRAKRRVGLALGSAAMKADAKQTEFCIYLSAVLLVGLLLNVLFGWWWADPAAGLIMVPIIAKEGVNGLQGKACEDCCAG
jgi:divalent metal cation (Fe/Co/Zn/Cd) transporter